MAKLDNVEYKNENGKLLAVEFWDNGDVRFVRIKKGMVHYILNGSEDIIERIQEKGE